MSRTDIKVVLITGGYGFIGSALIRYINKHTKTKIINVDKLTYAANPESLDNHIDEARYIFKKYDISDRKCMYKLLSTYKPQAIINLAAETHVDRSIDGPADFIKTNIVGIYALLEAALEYWHGLDKSDKKNFIFHHVSTDEVFGSITGQEKFTEHSPYRPNSPYSASKAAADHLVRAWGETYKLPTIVTNCTNNYGPYQNPEKFIPTVVINAILGNKIPIYNDGSNIRDWIHVDDHARALWHVVNHGNHSDIYNIGADNERTNISVAKEICAILDELLPGSEYKPHENLIEFVKDRPGHDKRYSIDASKIMNELGWKPKEDYEKGLYKTVKWYLDNRDWWEKMARNTHLGERMGLSREINNQEI